MIVEFCLWVLSGKRLLNIKFTENPTKINAPEDCNLMLSQLLTSLLDFFDDFFCYCSKTKATLLTSELVTLKLC